MTYLTSVSDGVADGGSTTFDSPALTISGSNKVLYALVDSSDGSPAVPTGVVLDPTGVNQALTLLGSGIAYATYASASLWRLIAPSDVTAKIVRATWEATQGERMMVVLVETDIDQVTPNGTVQTGSTSTGATSHAVSTSAVSTAAGQRVLMFGAGLSTVGDFGGTSTPWFSPSGTERQDGVTRNTWYGAFAAQEQTASGSSTTPTWTLGNGSVTIDGYAAFAFALNVAGAAAPSLLPVQTLLQRMPALRMR